MIVALSLTFLTLLKSSYLVLFSWGKCKKVEKSHLWETLFTWYLHNGSTLQHNSNRSRKLQCRATTLLGNAHRPYKQLSNITTPSLFFSWIFSYFFFIWNYKIYHIWHFLVFIPVTGFQCHSVPVNSGDCSGEITGISKFWRTLPCPTYSTWTLLESRWFSRVHLESRCFFFGWEHSQIGMHNPPGSHQDSRWTPDEPHGVSGVHLLDSSVDSTSTHPRVNPPGVQEESI